MQENEVAKWPVKNREGENPLESLTLRLPVPNTQKQNTGQLPHLAAEFLKFVADCVLSLALKIDGASIPTLTGRRGLSLVHDIGLELTTQLLGGMKTATRNTTNIGLLRSFLIRAKRGVTSGRTSRSQLALPNLDGPSSVSVEKYVPKSYMPPEKLAEVQAELARIGGQKIQTSGANDDGLYVCK